jgi:hypothetical protein
MFFRKPVVTLKNRSIPSVLAALALLTLVASCHAFTTTHHTILKRASGQSSTYHEQGTRTRHRRAKQVYISEHSSQALQKRSGSNHHLHMLSPDIILSAYSTALQQHPTVTKGATGLVLCGIGDVIAQLRSPMITVNKNQNDSDLNLLRLYVDSINYRRLSRFAIKGFFGAIIWGTWYELSANLISTDNITSILSSLGVEAGLIENNIFITIIRTISFMLTEQFVACPILFGLWEIPAATVMNNAPLERIPYEIEDKLKDMLIANAKVWTAANVIIYNIPVQYRVGLSNVIDIFWQSIVSDFAADCGTEGCSVDDDRYEEPDDSTIVPLRTDDRLVTSKTEEVVWAKEEVLM